MTRLPLPVCLLTLLTLAAAPSLRARAPEDPAEPALTGGLLVQLEVADLERSIRFYSDVLGFKVTERRDDLAFAHVATGLEGLQLGLSAGGSRPPKPGSAILNFDVRGDVEVLRAQLTEKGVEFRGPTEVIPGKVRLATFLDPDGYVLRLAGDDLPPPAGAGR